MRVMRQLVLLGFAITSGACGDGATSPAPSATAVADRFDRMADSIERAGDPDNAMLARTVAGFTRAVGQIGTITVQVSGKSKTYTALAAEIWLPPSLCEGDSQCLAEIAKGLQVMLAWHGNSLDESLFLISTRRGVDPVNEYDFSTSGASYSSNRTTLWHVKSGSISTEAPRTGAPCMTSTVTAPVATYTCTTSEFTFSTSLVIQQINEDGIPIGSTATLSVAPQTVHGAVVHVTELGALMASMHSGASVLTTVPRAAVRRFQERSSAPLSRGR